MTLATHAAVGAIAAVRFPQHPILAFCLAFGSHFILDAIPHWDYHPASLQEEKDPLKNKMPVTWGLIKDLLQTGTDFLVGLIVVLILFWNFNFWLAVLGVFAGVLPDALQFIYFQYPKGPILWLQKFHMWVHTENHMERKMWLSLASQVVLVSVLFLTIR